MRLPWDGLFATLIFSSAACTGANNISPPSDASLPRDRHVAADVEPSDSSRARDIQTVTDAAPIADSQASTLDMLRDAGAADTNHALDTGPAHDRGRIPGGCNVRTFVYLAPKAKRVYVTGAFTRPIPWAGLPRDGALPMVEESHGLFILRKYFSTRGFHRYKYIVDESWWWEDDPFNPEKESDGRGGINSIAGNWQTFAYVDFYATAVWLSGSFTSPPWSREHALPMRLLPKSSVFVLPLELSTGRHRYKFIVKELSGKIRWKHDPLASLKEPDGTGLGFNSVVDVCRAP